MKKRLIQIVIGLLALLLLALLLSKCSEQGKVDSSDLSFVIPEEGLVVERDYNQQRIVGIRNDGSEIAAIRLVAEGPPEIPSGFVGRGTPDWEVPDTLLTVSPGETWDVPLLVHADRAEAETVTLLLKATLGLDGAVAASKELEVKIETPKLELETTWLEVDEEPLKARLAKRLRIRNVGASISDLSMIFENSSEDGGVIFEPQLEFTRLSRGEEIEVLVRPKLHPWFTAAEGNVVLSGLNQKVEVPYSAAVAEGEQVFVTLARSTGFSSNSGSRCTNRQSVGYSLPPVGGTPGPNPEPPEEEEFGGQAGSMGGTSGGGDMDPWPDEWEESWEPETTEDTEEEKAPEESLTSSPEKEKGKNEEPKEEKEPRSGKKPIIIDLPLGEEDTPLGPEHQRSIPATDLLDANSEGLLTDQLAAVLDFGDFEALTFLDDEGRKTHVTSEADDENSGARFLNFSFGIQPGRKLRVPVRLDYPVSSLTLGPSPAAEEGDGGAAAAYTKVGENGESIIEVLDPFSGKSAEVGAGETPQLTKEGLVYVDQGKLRRSQIAPDLSAALDEQWEWNGVESGPILGVTKGEDGASWILTKEGAETIALRGADGSIRELQGSDASVRALGGTPVVAVRRTDGSVDIINTDETVTNLIAASLGTFSPRLVSTDDGGLRLFLQKQLPETPEPAARGTEAGGAFSFDFREGKWSEPKRIFQVQPSVSHTAVAINFDVPFGTAHYKPMNLQVHLNNFEIGRLDAKVPSGRYVFHAPPSKLYYESPGARFESGTNRIRINSQGIGPGNFHLTDHCAIYTKHDFVEECLVASTAEDAERLAQLTTPLIRHSVADLMVASNGWEIPRNAKPGERLTLQIGLFNSGDLTAETGALVASVLGETVGEASRPEVTPFEGKVVPLEVTLPDDWNPEESLSVRVVAELPGDVNPDDNALDFDLYKALQPQIAGPEIPGNFDFSRIDPVMIPDSSETPTETPMSGEGIWYQTSIPPTGDLQLEVEGPGSDLIDRIDLYDEEGRYLSPNRGEWATDSKLLNIRVGLPPGTTLPSGTLLRLWWE